MGNKIYREDVARGGNHAKDRPQAEIESQRQQELLLKRQSGKAVSQLRAQGYDVRLRRERNYRGLEVLPDPVRYAGYIGWKVR